MTDRDSIRFIASHLVDIEAAKAANKRVYYLYDSSINGKVSINLGNTVDFNAFDSREAAERWLGFAMRMMGMDIMGSVRVEEMSLFEFIQEYEE